MGKVYTLPGNLFNKRVASKIVGFDIVRAGGLKHGRFKLECGHTQDTVQTMQPIHGATIVCRVCSGLADPQPAYTTTKGKT